MKARRWLQNWAWLAAGIVMVAGPTASASDVGQAAVEQVSQDSYRDFLDLWLYTHVGDDRGYGPEHNLARANIADLMESYGLAVTLEPFTYSSQTYYNVVGTKLGTVHPEQEYVIGAHYDSVNNPGADDNASGVALVLEAARIIGQYDSDYTIRFIAFDREEQGLIGSSAYVQAHILDDILGMISADMVAYDPSTNHALIYSHDSSAPLMVALGAAIVEYGDGLTWEDAGWIGASNHAPFDSAGFQAALLIEGEVWSNPYYHTQQDNYEQPGNLNFPYAVKMTRSILGWLVDHAGVQVAPLFVELPDGTPWRLDPGQPTTITIEIKNGSESYLPGSGRVHYRYAPDAPVFFDAALVPLGGSLYEATLPPPSCASRPQFYFSATGDEGTTVYSPEGAPGSLYTAQVATMTVFLADDFETDRGWTVEDLDIFTGTWERGLPAGSGQRGDPTADFDGSGQCYLTDNRPGNYDVDGGPTRLISPAIDLSGTASPLLAYARWFTNDDADADRLNVEVSDDDGASWTLLESVGHTDGWVERSTQLSSYVTPTAQFRVRFGASDSPNNSITEAAVDAVEVFELTCDLYATGDHDGDGDVDLPDFAWFQTCLSGEAELFPPEMGCNEFDFNGDLDVDLSDFAEFHAALTGAL